MPLPRTAKDNLLLVFLASVAFLISGIVMASQNPSAQEGYFFSPPHEGHLVPGYPISLEVLSSVPDKVNLDPYLRRVYVSIQSNLLAKLPESAVNGEKGVVAVRVRIQKEVRCLITPCGWWLARERGSWTKRPLARFAPLRPLDVSPKHTSTLVLTCSSRSTSIAPRSSRSQRRNQRSFP